MTGINNKPFCGGKIPALARKDNIDVPKDDFRVNIEVFLFLFYNIGPDDQGACQVNRPTFSSILKKSSFPGLILWAKYNASDYCISFFVASQRRFLPH